MGLIRKEQIDNGENLVFKDESLDLGINNITTTGTGTFSSVIVDTEDYSSNWSGSNTVATQGAIYNAIQAIGSGAVSSVNSQTGDVTLTTNEISENTNLYFTDERAQDAIGSMINSTLVYSDATPSLGRAAISGDITISAGSNISTITSGAILNVHINSGAAIDATKIGGGTISNTEFGYLNGVTSNIQTQLDGKQSTLTGLTASVTELNYTDGVTSPIQTQLDALSTDKIPYSETSTASISFVIDEDSFASNLATKVPTQQSVKAYIDSLAALSGDPSLLKDSCNVATTANITLSGEQTIDGVLTSSSRVLVKNQSTTSQNGIYVTSSGAWSRATDYDTAVEIKRGTSTFILSGTTNNNKQFVMISPDVSTLGTDPITFTAVKGINDIQDTNDVPEGSNNYYFTEDRFADTLETLLTVANSQANGYYGISFNRDFGLNTFSIGLDYLSVPDSPVNGLSYFLGGYDDSIYRVESSILYDAIHDSIKTTYGTVGAGSLASFQDSTGQIIDSGLKYSSNTLQPNTVLTSLTIQSSQPTTTAPTPSNLTLKAGNVRTSGSVGLAIQGGYTEILAGDGYDNFATTTPGAKLKLWGGFSDENAFYGFADLYTDKFSIANDTYSASISSPTIQSVNMYPKNTGYINTDNISTLTDGATIALNCNNGNIFTLTSLGNRTILAPTGTPHDGQKITIRHTASGANRTLSLTTGSAGAFRFGTDITSLSATDSGKTDYIGCIYNSSANRWDVVSVTKGF